MAQDHHIQTQRFELKYLVSAEQVAPIRDFISAYLELDDFSAAQPGRAYTIHSIYLDSPSLTTHLATVNGDKNRFKLRLRYYDVTEASPVFLEIKQRIDGCILKQRCPVRRDFIPQLLTGQLPDWNQILSQNPQHLSAAHRFYELQNRLGAAPRLHNRYLREAWVSPDDNSIRITFDQQIFVEPWFALHLADGVTAGRQIYAEFVVLEVKFTNRFPNWCQAMVEHFNLMRSAAMKYCGGVTELGEELFQNVTALMTEPTATPRHPKGTIHELAV
jgi:hypothetical protein